MFFLSAQIFLWKKFKISKRKQTRLPDCRKQTPQDKSSITKGLAGNEHKPRILDQNTFHSDLDHYCCLYLCASDLYQTSFHSRMFTVLLCHCYPGDLDLTFLTACFQGNDSERSNLKDASDVGQDSEGNRESSEITYEFTVDSVPLDFQNTARTDSSEESVVQEEIVEYFPAKPEVLEMGSPRRIPDLDSPKEHRTLTLPAENNQMEDDAEVAEETVEQVQEQFEQDIEKEPEKEEFVISLDELSNVDFSAMKPGEHREPRKESDIPKVNYRIEFRSSRDSEQDQSISEQVIQPVYEPDVHQEPVFYDDSGMDLIDGGVKNKCSELSFSPNSEGEAEHLLEEKSISMIALPAERTPVKKNQSNDVQSRDAPSPEPAQSQGDTPTSSTETSPRRDEATDSPNLMQAQYQQLQQQFAIWQNQLSQNQQLLASSGMPEVSANQSGVEDPSNFHLQQLQLQIQMQQQMLLQLQQSMHTLALQNTLANQQPATQLLTAPTEPPPPPPAAPAPSAEQEKPPPAPEPPIAPAPPAMQVAASKPKPSKADAKYTKPKQKRFERQLDPREQLMLDIRNFGKGHLKKVRI